MPRRSESGSSSTTEFPVYVIAKAKLLTEKKGKLFSHSDQIELWVSGTTHKAEMFRVSVTGRETFLNYQIE